MPIVLAPLVAALRAADRILMTTHSAPDGDGIGCLLALRRALTSLGKQVQLLTPGSIPRRFTFLPGSDAIRDTATLAPAELSAAARDADLILVVDTHEWSLFGALGQLLREGNWPLFFLDHHPLSRRDPARIFCDPEASSAGEVCWQLLCALEVAPDPEIATCLYAAIAYDTNMFRYLRGRAATHRIAADLIDAGAQSDLVYRHIFAADPPGKVALLGELLQSLQRAAAGRVAWAVIRLEQIARTGASRDDLRDMIVPLLQIEGVEVALTFKESRDGVFKVSLRSKGRFPVDRVAAELGGGGHAFAAGAHVAGPLENATRRVLGLLELAGVEDPLPESSDQA